MTELLGIRTADGVILDAHLTHDAGTAPDAPVVVVCHGFVQNALAFEVPQRSLLAHLRSLGWHVATIELRGRSRSKGDTARGLHEYTDVDAPAIIEALRSRGHRRVAWLGHSMGGLVATCLPESATAQLDAVVTIGSPLFAGRPGLHFTRSTAAAVRGARAAHARGLAFRGRRWSTLLHSLRRVLDTPWAPSPIRLWAPGSLREDALAFTLQQSFADDSWAVLADLLELVVTNGERAGRVDVNARLARFDRPALLITGDADDLAPRAGARPLFERIGSTHKEYLEVGVHSSGTRAGHIDLLVGDAAPSLVWPAIATFLRRHIG